MCGSPRGPLVAHCITICSARKSRTSSSDIWISLRRDGKLFRGLEHGAPGLLGLEHHRVAGLLQDLAGEPLIGGVGALEDHGAVGELGRPRMVLAHPARAL